MSVLRELDLIDGSVTQSRSARAATRGSAIHQTRRMHRGGRVSVQSEKEVAGEGATFRALARPLLLLAIRER